MRLTNIVKIPRLLPSVVTKIHLRPTNIHKIRSYTSASSFLLESDFKGDDLIAPSWDMGGQTANNSMTPLYSSMKTLIDKNPDAVCLIQVGSFYELYFDHARIYGPQLGLKVAERKTSNYNIPMAGFPVHQLQKFVKLLVQDISVNVAIIDQYPGFQSDNEKIIHRKISRIITPGTLVDETFMNYNENNYLLAISFPPQIQKQPVDIDTVVGLSWIDVSVGDFYVQQTTLGNLISDVSRIGPSEIIMSKDVELDELVSWYQPLMDLKRYFLRYHKTVYLDLKLSFGVNETQVRQVVETFEVREEAAMNMVLSYVNVNLPERNPSLDLPIKYWNERYLRMDSRTRDSLELVERNGYSGKNLSVGSLMNTIKRTVTPSGTRMLTEWIKSPILNVKEIKNRQDFVKFFNNEPHQGLVIEEMLKKLGDFVRSGQRLALGTGDIVTNLKTLADGIRITHELRNYLSSNNVGNTLIEELIQELDVPIELSDVIDDTFLDPFHQLSDELEEFREFKSHFLVKPDHSPELVELHTQLSALREEEGKLFKKIRKKLEKVDEKLNIQIKPQHGKFNDVIYVSGKAKLIVEVNTAFEKDLKEKRKGLVLIKPKKWHVIQLDLNGIIEGIQIAEKMIINDLKTQVISQLTRIRKVSRRCDFLDITLLFLKLSKEFNLVCPEFLDEPNLVIKDGRHIVVESSLRNIGTNFIDNDTNLTTERCWIITGPNMGGKSTFLRQNAIITILAQIGSFVPASKCEIGVVDKIFTRIGALDDLFNDLSTFMVEMIEVSNVLANATPNSLAIVDEIGRGTSGKEGLAVAYASLIGLSARCRTLFATHFGRELQSLLQKTTNEVHEKTTNELQRETTNELQLEIDLAKSKIGYYKTGVVGDSIDSHSDIILDHKLSKGISEKSYAIEIAKVSGFPEKNIRLAKHALALIDKGST